MSEPVGELPSAIEQARSAERNRSSTPPGRSASSPPGSHVVAFGGTRTYHRLACAIEDAGFEIRDMVAW